MSGEADYALLRLLWGNALKRNDISQLSVRDFAPTSKTLRIRGKGRGTKSELVDLGAVTVQAIADWLEVKPIRAGETDPLFTALDFPNWDIG